MVKALLAVLLSLPSAALACDCPMNGPSTIEEKAAQYRTWKLDYVIIEGEIIEKTSVKLGEREGHDGIVRPVMRPELRVLVKTGDGDVLAGSVLEIIGQDGINCNVRTSLFQPAEKYRFLLRRSYFEPAKFDLSDCGTHHERIK